MACTLASPQSASGVVGQTKGRDDSDEGSALFHLLLPLRLFSAVASLFTPRLSTSILRPSEVIVHSFTITQPHALCPSSITSLGLCPQEPDTLILTTATLLRFPSIHHSFVHETQLTSNDNSYSRCASPSPSSPRNNVRPKQTSKGLALTTPIAVSRVAYQNTRLTYKQLQWNSQEPSQSATSVPIWLLSHQRGPILSENMPALSTATKFHHQSNSYQPPMF